MSTTDKKKKDEKAPSSGKKKPLGSSTSKTRDASQKGEKKPKKEDSPPKKKKVPREASESPPKKKKKKEDGTDKSKSKSKTRKAGDEKSTKKKKKPTGDKEEQKSAKKPSTKKKPSSEGAGQEEAKVVQFQQPPAVPKSAEQIQMEIANQLLMERLKKLEETNSQLQRQDPNDPFHTMQNRFNNFNEHQEVAGPNGYFNDDGSPMINPLKLSMYKALNSKYRDLDHREPNFLKPPSNRSAQTPREEQDRFQNNRREGNNNNSQRKPQKYGNGYDEGSVGQIPECEMQMEDTQSMDGGVNMFDDRRMNGADRPVRGGNNVQKKRIYSESNQEEQEEIEFDDMGNPITPQPKSKQGKQRTKKNSELPPVSDQRSKQQSSSKKTNPRVDESDLQESQSEQPEEENFSQSMQSMSQAPPSTRGNPALLEGRDIESLTHEEAIEEVQKLQDKVLDLQQLNSELKKKVVKYKKQIEVIPELQLQLKKMKKSLETAKVSNGAQLGNIQSQIDGLQADIPIQMESFNGLGDMFEDPAEVEAKSADMLNKLQTRFNKLFTNKEQQLPAAINQLQAHFQTLVQEELGKQPTPQMMQQLQQHFTQLAKTDTTKQAVPKMLLSLSTHIKSLVKEDQQEKKQLKLMSQFFTQAVQQPPNNSSQPSNNLIQPPQNMLNQMLQQHFTQLAAQAPPLPAQVANNPQLNNQLQSAFQNMIQQTGSNNNSQQVLGQLQNHFAQILQNNNQPPATPQVMQQMAQHFQHQINSNQAANPMSMMNQYFQQKMNQPITQNQAEMSASPFIQGIPSAATFNNSNPSEFMQSSYQQDNQQFSVNAGSQPINMGQQQQYANQLSQIGQMPVNNGQQIMQPTQQNAPMQQQQQFNNNEKQQINQFQQQPTVQSIPIIETQQPNGEKKSLGAMLKELKEKKLQEEQQTRNMVPTQMTQQSTMQSSIGQQQPLYNQGIAQQYAGNNGMQTNGIQQYAQQDNAMVGYQNGATQNVYAQQQPVQQQFQMIPQQQQYQTPIQQQQQQYPQQNTNLQQQQFTNQVNSTPLQQQQQQILQQSSLNGNGFSIQPQMITTTNGLPNQQQSPQSFSQQPQWNPQVLSQQQQQQQPQWNQQQTAQMIQQQQQQQQQPTRPIEQTGPSMSGLQLKQILQANSSTKNNIDYSFGVSKPSQENLQQLRRQLDVKDEKTFAFLKENVELKGQISELKEVLIKKSHIVENLCSEIKINIGDMRYIQQKLNRGEYLQVPEDEVTAKFLVSQIDQLIEEKLSTQKDMNDRTNLLEERINGLKDQILTLQEMLDKKQESLLQQQAKLSSVEDISKNLRQEISLRQDSDKLLEHFKQHVKNHLLNVRHQLEAASTDYNTSSSSPGKNNSLRKSITDKLHEMGIDQLFEQISDKAQAACIGERKLLATVDQLELELQQRQREMHQQQRESDERRQQIIRDEEEHRYKLQEHIKKLEDHLEKSKYDRSFNMIDTDARIKAKDLQFQQMKEEIEILEAFLGEAFHRFKVLNFEKTYLEVEAKSAWDSLSKVESELRRYLPNRDIAYRPKKHRTFKKVARAIIFAHRIKKVSQFQPSEIFQRRKALGRLLDNWMNNRQYWDGSIKQNLRIFNFVEGLHHRLTQQRALKLSELPRRHLNDEKMEFVDALKVRLRELEIHQNGDQPRMNKFEQQPERSHSPLRQNFMTQRGGFANEQNNQPEELVVKLRGVVRDMESKMEESVHTYEQKIKYLKQEIEMKRLQIDNMKRLIEFREASGHERKFSATQPLFNHASNGSQTRNSGGYGLTQAPPLSNQRYSGSNNNNGHAGTYHN